MSKMLFLKFLSLFWFVIQNIKPHVSVWTGFDLIKPSKSVTGKSFSKISFRQGNGPNVTQGSQFGFSVANIGDIDGNGVDDLAVGAIGEGSTYNSSFTVSSQAGTGAVYILLMGGDGKVSSFTRISGLTGGGPQLYDNDQFGYSITSLGDLDGDGINDIAVGAPGLVVSAVYVLFLKQNGESRKYRMIRGKYYTREVTGLVTASFTSSAYSPNGPPISYNSRFGTAVSSIGDFDKDGTIDLACSAIDASVGEAKLYLLFLYPNASVKSYTEISSSKGGGPLISEPFSGFGSSVVPMGDLNGDGVVDLAVGARLLDDHGSSSYRSGVVFILFMYPNGTAKSHTRISQLQLSGNKKALPLEEDDQCGTSLAFMGDFNKDNMKSKHPLQYSNRNRPSVPDIIVGCPQVLHNNLPGKVVVYLLTKDGFLLDYILIPHPKNLYAPNLPQNSRFGSSIAAYQDINHIGIQSLAIGAPGDSDSSGAIYIFFLSRNEYSTRFIDPMPYILSIALPILFFCLVFWFGLGFFFWFFRRKVDDIEIAVKKSGMEITRDRKRKRQDFSRDGKIYAEDYVV